MLDHNYNTNYNEDVKVYKKTIPNRHEIIIINMKTGEFISYPQDKKLGFPFDIPNRTTISEMGYKNIKDCIKALKERKFLGTEINYKDQKESERIGYINLGIERIKRNNRINTKDFEDIIIKLSEYGMGFVDAYNCIVESYLHSIN